MTSLYVEGVHLCTDHEAVAMRHAREMTRQGWSIEDESGRAVTKAMIDAALDVQPEDDEDEEFFFPEG